MELDEGTAIGEGEMPEDSRGFLRDSVDCGGEKETGKKLRLQLNGK